MKINRVHNGSCHCKAVQFELDLPNGLERRSSPEQYAVNVACLDGVNPFKLGDVPIMDGVNHPADRDT